MSRFKEYAVVSETSNCVYGALLVDARTGGITKFRGLTFGVYQQDRLVRKDTVFLSDTRRYTEQLKSIGPHKFCARNTDRPEDLILQLEWYNAVRLELNDQ